MTPDASTQVGMGVRRQSMVRVTLGLLVWALVIGAGVYFGELGQYRQALDSFQLIPFLGLCAVLVTCNLLRVLRLKILIPEVRLLPLARAAFTHQFLAGLLPAKLGELALPVMLAQNGKVTGSEAVGVLLSARLLDLGALLAVAAVALVAAGGSVDTRAPGYAIGALALLGLGAASVFYLARTLHAKPQGKSRLQRLGRSLLMPLGRLSIGSFVATAAVTLVVWALLLGAFYLGCISFQLVALPGEVVLAAAAGNLMAALPVNGFGGVGLSQLSWAGVMSAFGRDFETALIVGIAVQAVALLVSGAGALVMLGLTLAIKHDSGGGKC